MSPESRRRRLDPEPEMVARARIRNYDETREEALKDIVAFWESRARSSNGTSVDEGAGRLEGAVLPVVVGAKTNIVHNALDRHQANATRNKLAFIWEARTERSARSPTTRSIARCPFSRTCAEHGVKRGTGHDLLRDLELPISMLACAKIGAVHSVCTAASPSRPPRSHRGLGSRVLITADGGVPAREGDPSEGDADEAVQAPAWWST